MKKAVILTFLLVFTLSNTANAAEPNLVSHWKFDEGGGTVVYDSVGDNNGTVYGAKWTTDGRVDGALSFDGDCDYVDVGDIGIMGDWTICFWAKSNDNTGTVYYPIGLSTSQESIIMGGTAATVRQHISIYDGVYQLRSSTIVQPGIWYHIAITKDETNYSIYVDGIHKVTGRLNDIDLTDFKIGTRPDLFGYFNGTIDDVGIWNRALSVGDIDDPDPGTINYVRLNGVSGADYVTACNPNPSNGLTDVVKGVVLRWRPVDCVADVNGHNVYFGTDFNDVNEGTISYVTISEPNYNPGIVDFNTAYYWRVDEVNDPCIWKGNVWQFTTRSGSVSNLYPAGNMENVALDVELSWRAGDRAADANGHDMYIGTDFNAVKDANAVLLVGDVDGNGVVDFGDVEVLSSQWLEDFGGSEPVADLDGNKKVDLVDFTMMAADWDGTTIYKGRLDVNSYNPYDLEFDTTYYCWVDEVNDPCIWSGDVYSFTTKLEGALPTLLNAAAPEIIPTYDGSGQAMHPDVIYFPDGWSGYKYWMAMTPYPYGDPQEENPSVLASNDGSCWEVPPGLANPLIGPPSPGYNADPDIVYNDDADELWVYFLRYWSDAGLVKLTLMRSSDGISWSEPEYLITWDWNIQDNERSYAIIKQGLDWHYWAQCFDAPEAIFYRNSTDGRNWSEAQEVGFSPAPSALPWHLDVIYVPSKLEYWMLFNVYAAGELFLAKSQDRLNWILYPNAVLSPTGSGWDNKQIYRPTLLYDSSSHLLEVWYSARNTVSEWHTGYTETQY